MITPRPRLASTILALACAGALAAAAVSLLTPGPGNTVDGVPLPFGGAPSSLQGSVTRLGVRNGLVVHRVDFPAGTASESIGPDAVYLVYTPTSGVEDVALDVAVRGLDGASAVNSFGYRYVSADAATEIAHRDDPAFTRRFPGTFFASAKAFAEDARHGDELTRFAQERGITFRDTRGVRLEPGALYLLVVNDAGATVRVREFPPRCGDGTVTAPEACDDGNAADGDGCTASCGMEDGFLCSGAPSRCEPVPAEDPCGNGAVDAGEECDEGENNGIEGGICTAECTLDIPPLPLGDIPSGSPVCGNGVRESGEACDDGNAVSGDGCSAGCDEEGDSPEAQTTLSVTFMGPSSVRIDQIDEDKPVDMQVAVRNTGQSSAQDLRLSGLFAGVPAPDQPAGECQPADASLAGTAEARSVICRRPALGPGEVWNVTLRYRIRNMGCRETGLFSFQPGISARNVNGGETAWSFTNVTEICASGDGPHVVWKVSDAPAESRLGYPFPVRLRLVNEGRGDAGAIKLTLQKPNWSVSGLGGEQTDIRCHGQGVSISCDLDGLRHGASDEVTGVLTFGNNRYNPAECDELVDIEARLWGTAGQPASATARVRMTCPGPDLRTSLTMSRNGTQGTSVAVRVTNAGSESFAPFGDPQRRESVMLPTFIGYAGPGCTSGPGGVRCTLTQTLAPGAYQEFVITSAANDYTSCPAGQTLNTDHALTGFVYDTDGQIMYHTRARQLACGPG